MLTTVLTPLANGSFLITPNVGIMIWTIVVFAISLFILRRAVFPRIGEALDKRAKTIEGEIDAAGQLRQEADKVLAEYRERLKEARAQSDEIVQRARQSAEVHEKESKERGRETVAEATKRAQREIEVATKRALDDLRREVGGDPEYLRMYWQERLRAARRVFNDPEQVEQIVAILETAGGER